MQCSPCVAPASFPMGAHHKTNILSRNPGFSNRCPSLNQERYRPLHPRFPNQSHAVSHPRCSINATSAGDPAPRLLSALGANPTPNASAYVATPRIQPELIPNFDASKKPAVSKKTDEVCAHASPKCLNFDTDLTCDGRMMLHCGVRVVLSEDACSF